MSAETKQNVDAAAPAGKNPMVYIKAYLGVYAVFCVAYCVYCFTAYYELKPEDYFQNAFPGASTSTASEESLKQTFNENAGHIRIWDQLQFDGVNGERFRIEKGEELTKPDAIGLGLAVAADLARPEKERKLSAPIRVHKSGVFANLDWQKLLTLYNLFGLAMLFYLFGKAPFLKFLDDTRVKTAEAVERARKAEAEAAELKQRYEKLLAEVAAEKARLAELGKVEFAEEREQILAAAKAESDALLAGMKESIAAETTLAVGRLRERACAEAVRAARELLEKEAGEDDHTYAVDSFIGNLRKARLG